MALAKNHNNKADGSFKNLMSAKMEGHVLLDLQEWPLLLNKMLRYHYNICEEI